MLRVVNVELFPPPCSACRTNATSSILASNSVYLLSDAMYIKYFQQLINLAEVDECEDSHHSCSNYKLDNYKLIALGIMLLTEGIVLNIINRGVIRHIIIE